MSKRPFCVKGGEIIGNVPTIEELAVYIKEYILNDVYGVAWGTDTVKGATRQAVYNIIQQIVGQLEYKGLWDASSENYPDDPELGWYYVVSVAGEVGGVYYYIGDWIIWNGTSWDKLAGQRDVMPIGTILMYNGIGIANVATREVQIGDEVGDLIKMAGWYVCNGLASTPYMTDHFIRGKTVSGSTGGSNDAVVVEHTHARVEVGGGTGSDLAIVATSSYNQKLFVAGVGLVEAESVSGVDKNIPKYYSVIFIVKMG